MLAVSPDRLESYEPRSVGTLLRVELIGETEDRGEWCPHLVAHARKERTLGPGCFLGDVSSPHQFFGLLGELGRLPLDPNSCGLDLSGVAEEFLGGTLYRGDVPGDSGVGEEPFGQAVVGGEAGLLPHHLLPRPEMGGAP